MEQTIVAKVAIEIETAIIHGEIHCQNGKYEVQLGRSTFPIEAEDNVGALNAGMALIGEKIKLFALPIEVY